jgi:hypothetical protein
MDREVVEQKLESLRRCLQRVETKCPADADTLAADFDLQDIVSLMSLISASTPLLADVRQLIDSARQRVASTVNAELTQLYWQIGSRVSAELLKGQPAEYGKQAVAELSSRYLGHPGRPVIPCGGSGTLLWKRST